MTSRPGAGRSGYAVRIHNKGSQITYRDAWAVFDDDVTAHGKRKDCPIAVFQTRSEARNFAEFLGMSVRRCSSATVNVVSG